MSEEKRSPKHEQARQALPSELRAAFDELVEDYKFAGVVHYQTPFVSYLILADLVRGGWRCAKPRKQQ